MDQAPDEKIAALLEALWQKNLPVLRERLDFLDQAANDAFTSTLTSENHLEALGIAHKLSGSLGMFGYAKGTEIARKMEQILKNPTPEGLHSLRGLATDLRAELPLPPIPQPPQK